TVSVIALLRRDLLGDAGGVGGVVVERIDVVGVGPGVRGRDRYGAGRGPDVLTHRQVHDGRVVGVQDVGDDLVLRVPHDVAVGRAERRGERDAGVRVSNGGASGSVGV